MLLLAASFLAFLVAAVAVPDAPTDLRFHVSPAAELNIFWGVYGDSIRFELHAHTTGWVGFGISASGGMVNADVVTGWVTAAGSAFLQDRWTTEHARPEVDDEQNWELEFGREEDGVTALRFSRKISAEGRPEDLDITDDTLHVIWALGPDDPTSADELTFHEQGQGSSDIHLLRYDAGDSFNRSSYQLFTFSNSGFELPTASLTYHCRGFPAPRDFRSATMHVKAYEPRLSDAVGPMVHQMVLYACAKSVDPDVVAGLNGFCLTNPEVLSQCRLPVAVWGRGSPIHVFAPRQAVELDFRKLAAVLLLELHYRNPTGAPPVALDDSGIALYVTDVAPTEPLGALFVGVTQDVGNILPARVASLTQRGVAHDHCFRLVGRDAPVTVTSWSPLMHTFGRSLRIRHFRSDKQELPLLGEDNQFNFDSQSYHDLLTPRILSPGDWLFVECEYNTSTASAAVVFGLADTEEQCAALLLYHPSGQVDGCTSMPMADAQLSPLGAVVEVDGRGGYEITQPPEWAHETAYDIIDSVDWSVPSRLDDFQRSINSGNHEYQSVLINGTTLFSYGMVPSGDGMTCGSRRLGILLVVTIPFLGLFIM